MKSSVSPSFPILDKSLFISMPLPKIWVPSVLLCFTHDYGDRSWCYKMRFTFLAFPEGFAICSGLALIFFPQVQVEQLL
jgi:hypothetical protein